MDGWRYKKRKNADNQKFSYLPEGWVRTLEGYILPPYLFTAYSLFSKGYRVFGKSWKQQNGHAWSSKKGRNVRKSHAPSKAVYLKHLEEFFAIAPCVPYHEQRWRFPKDCLNGNYFKEQRNKQKGQGKRERRKQAAEEQRLAQERKRAAALKAIRQTEVAQAKRELKEQQFDRS